MSKNIQLTDAKNKQYNYTKYFDSQPLNGPLEHRSCTDTFCCLLFILNIIAFIGLASYGYIQGQPSALLAFYDTNQFKCQGSFPFAYMPNIVNQDYSVVCVNTCPSTNNQTVSCHTSSLCATGNLSNTYQCISLGNIYCSPDPNTNTYVQKLNLNYLTQIFADLKISYLVILGALFASLIVGFIYFALMRCCAGVMIWGSLVTFVLALLAVGTYMFLFTKGITFFKVPFNLASYSSLSLQISAYVLWGLGVLTILMVACMFKRIRIGVAVVKSTAMYISETFHVIMIPPLMGLIMIFWIAVSILAFFFLYSVGSLTLTSPFASVNRAQFVDDFIYYEIFSGVWILFFVSGLSNFVLSSAACIWYFGNSSIEERPHKPVSTSLLRAFCYHGGSIAFGSLLLATLFIIRVIVAFLQIKGQAAGQSKLSQYCFKCLSCCLTMFNCCMKFLTKGAYIQIALKGKNYCSSSIDAFEIISQNPIKLALNSGLSSIIMFIGKLTITAVISTAAYYCIVRVNYYVLLVSSPVVPTAICGLIAYSIASIYMSIYGISSNAIIQCFIMDQLESKQRGKKAIYCPAPLREIIDDHTFE